MSLERAADPRPARRGRPHRRRRGPAARRHARPAPRASPPAADAAPGCWSPPSRWWSSCWSSPSASDVWAAGSTAGRRRPTTAGRWKRRSAARRRSPSTGLARGRTTRSCRTSTPVLARRPGSSVLPASPSPGTATTRRCASATPTAAWPAPRRTRGAATAGASTRPPSARARRRRHPGARREPAAARGPRRDAVPREEPGARPCRGGARRRPVDVRRRRAGAAPHDLGRALRAAGLPDRREAGEHGRSGSPDAASRPADVDAVLRPPDDSVGAAHGPGLLGGLRRRRQREVGARRRHRGAYGSRSRGWPGALYLLLAHKADVRAVTVRTDSGSTTVPVGTIRSDVRPRAAVPPVARGIDLDRLPQRQPVDVGPQHVGEHELAVRRLPQHEVREPLLPRRAPHQVGVRRARGRRGAARTPSRRPCRGSAGRPPPRGRSTGPRRRAPSGRRS